MYSDEIESAFDAFAGSLLSEDTDVRSMVVPSPGDCIVLQFENGQCFISADEALALTDKNLDDQQLRSLTVSWSLAVHTLGLK